MPLAGVRQGVSGTDFEHDGTQIIDDKDLSNGNLIWQI